MATIIICGTQNNNIGMATNGQRNWQKALDRQTTSLQNPATTFPVEGDQRYYNKTFKGFHISNSAIQDSTKNLPNVNEMTWYAMKGDPRWDDDELWSAMGHLYKGGMWFYKKRKYS